MLQFWSRNALLISDRPSWRRERALAREVSTLRRALVVARSEKAQAERILESAARDVRNGVPLATHIATCNQLHRAEARIRELSEGYL